MKCRKCGMHSNRIRPCTQCSTMTCYSCTIEAMCPDCWVRINARAIERKDYAYFEYILKKVRAGT